ncbi:Uu.00g022690.m01.CDS01 [Anthostomella pinea]|uniref:Uu.00g022690.m01.CDS01 n=1 Tax=Anthostomella pinea TaxID=933095 RepID=A0AAI8YR05_9PEZI|nr:Uu.00g022690.m01.CDS01 [Anthostomella pinea]
MGLLSFLSRKPSGEGQYPPAILKAQAYDATVPALPPIRGTYPVAGNGRSILEQFHKSHPNLASIDPHDTAAPPPLVPRTRRDSIRSDGTGHPSTAASSQLADIRGRSQSAAGTRAQPKVELPPPPKKKFGPYRLPPKVPENLHYAFDTAEFTAPSPAFARTRASSHSGDSGSAKAFVDLLDAHSLIKPGDFYGRVEAAGARNYGEDVADRNLGENGSDLNLSGPQGSRARRTVPSTIDDEYEDDQPRRSRKRHSMGSGLRTKSAHANGARDTFPQRMSSRVPHEPAHPESTSMNESRVASKAEKTARRRSLPSYAVHSSTTDATRGSSNRRRIRVMDPNDFPEALRDRARAAAAQEDHTNSPPAKPNSKTTESPRITRDHVLHAKGKATEDHAQHTRKDYEYRSHHKRNSSEQTIPERDLLIRTRPTQHSSRRKTIGYDMPLSVPKSPSKRHTLQAPGVASHRGVKEEVTQQRSTPQSPRKARDRNMSSRHLGSITDLPNTLHALPTPQPAQASQVKPSSGRPVSQDGPNYHIRNRSIVSLSNKSIMPFGIKDSIPERTSSIRHWSLTSETGGSQSSNPFKPESGHTTNTSLDHAPILSLSKTMNLVPALESRTEPRARSSVKGIGLSSPIRSAAKSHRHKTSKDFNIDDYISSDDSYHLPSRPRGEDERDLLFADAGFGFTGSQLPGLPGMFDIASPKSVSSRSDRPKSLKASRTPYHLVAFSFSNVNELSTGKGPQHTNSQNRVSHFQMPAFSYTDSEDEDGDGIVNSSDEELSFDIPFSRTGAPRRDNPRGAMPWHENDTTRIVEEEDADLDDFSAIIRRRKEEKAKRRASHTSLRRVKGKGRAPDMPRLGLDDLSGYADAE